MLFRFQVHCVTQHIEEFLEIVNTGASSGSLKVVFLLEYV